VSAGPARRAACEALGSAALVAVVVGSGIQAAALTDDTAVRLLANALATVLGLGVLIVLFGPISGAHLNPAVSLAHWLTGRMSGRELACYALAQTSGALAGAVLANAMFALPPVALAGTDRAGTHLWLGELVATAGLVLLVLVLARTGRDHLAPAAVASFIGAAYWFTSSTAFANPAVTVGRAVTDTFAGIAPASVPPFLAAQLVGAVVGTGLAALVAARPLRTPTTGAP
jgi:glycerol uptake facilitator-like aquaporin